ncbi:tetratricopeptide repeat protein [Bradyrhizobium liaoningense]|uniref:tetratricopeptide repeat protein n=1 Tax=Bradyrhizobium liaoningense TaxID=43992 RepID=UPI001BA7E25B|nr:winged helix-turn-helix domain-containing tetratricopeptide repeat protein [Bradyrhizobium liaoningense]MBR0719214.1 tetratricopeptide repeat protein [Bradyrhizobium liaoningense]
MRYLFEDYALDVERRELYRGVNHVSVTPQVFDLLLYLIRNRERVVSKDELIEAIWEGRTVSEAALTTRLNAVRGAISDKGEEQRLIKTLPRKGVRFVGAVQELTERTREGEAVPETSIKPALPLPDKPSIAVLPFENMSGDLEQEYFADGMVEEITTALSRFKWLFVIARNSSFTFKGKAVDIKEVGRRLGVRYVLEGSVRRASGKVRISGQLIDAATGTHIWADRFERVLTDVFALQDELTVAVVSAIEPKLVQTEIAMATRRPLENLTAYDLYLRARQKTFLRTREGFAEAIRLAHRALDLDPRSISAAVVAANGHLNNVVLRFSTDPQFDRSEAVRLARLAFSLDENDERALSTAGLVTAFFIDDLETAIDYSDRAVVTNPNSYIVWNYRGWIYQVAGRYEEAMRSFERGIRLSPLDPVIHNYLAGIGSALIELRRFDEAVAFFKRALRQNSSDGIAIRGLASALAHLGRNAEAHQALAPLHKVDPTFTMSAWIALGGLSNSKLLIEGLLKAGAR